MHFPGQGSPSADTSAGDSSANTPLQGQVTLNRCQIRLPTSVSGRKPLPLLERLEFFQLVGGIKLRIELAMHRIAYNLIRSLMQRAALTYDAGSELLAVGHSLAYSSGAGDPWKFPRETPWKIVEDRTLKAGSNPPLSI